MKKINSFWFLVFLISIYIITSVLGNIEKNRAEETKKNEIILSKNNEIVAEFEEMDLNVEEIQEAKQETKNFEITAYCPCVHCCGKTDGITASGVKAIEGVTVATDNSIPFGTKIYIDGVGERIVQDRGGAIKGNKIDLYFDSHEKALEFGRQTKQVTILN